MEAKSKQAGTATEEGVVSEAIVSAEEQIQQSLSASSEDTEQDASPRKLNRRQIRDLIRGLPREQRFKYFWGRVKFPSKALPTPSNFVALRRQLGQ